ncbi:MAG: hypothetical protein ACFE8V_13010 [Promethearchaeota archaeon]
MSAHLKRNDTLKEFQSLHKSKIKFQAPLILRMYDALNKVNMRSTNRFILCNFLEQNSKLLEIEDLCYKNDEVSLDQLLIFTLNKAKRHNLIIALYDEYLNSIDAINNKKVI